MAAYVIVDSNVKNPDAMGPYIEKVGATVEPFQGKTLCAGTNIEVMEGDWKPKRFVIVEFPSMDKARDWYNSPAYQEILPIRLNNTDDKFILVEGL